MRRRQSVTQQEMYGLVVVLWFGIGIMITVFFLLGQIKSDLDFKTTLAFGFAYLISRGYLYMVESNYRQSRQHVQSDKDNPNTFWQEPLTKKSIKYIVGGIVGVFAAALIGSAINHPIFTPIFALSVSGIILLWVWMKSQNILAPIAVHGTYNGFVIALKYGLLGNSILTEKLKASLLSTNPIFVPEIGLGFEGYSKIATEIVFQYMLVATTEELMKIALTVFFILAFKGHFTKRGSSKYEAGIMAVVIWVALHTVQAVQL